MKTQGIALDHVGVVVRDLARASRSFEAMGFQLTPTQQQSGPVVPGGPVQPWGSANRCAMLPEGYIEILSLIDPSLYDNQLRAFLERGEGIHILALEVAKAQAEIERLGHAGFPDLRVHPLRRKARTAAGEVTVGFQRVPLPLDNLHGGRVQLLEHLSADILWQPGLTRHPNQAQALVEVLLRADTPERTADHYARLLGVRPRERDGTFEFALARGTLAIAPPPAIPERLGGWEVADGIDFAAFTVSTSDGNEAVRSRLAGNGVPFRELGTRLIVDPAWAGGAALAFVPAGGGSGHAGA